MKKPLNYLFIPDGNILKKEKLDLAKKEFKKRIVEHIVVLGGKDSEEDVIYMGKLLNEGDRIGIDTFPLHFKEYKELIKKAKRDGLFPRKVKVENIKTSENFKLMIYGELGYLEEKIKKRKLALMNKRHDGFLRGIKRIVKSILS